MSAVFISFEGIDGAGKSSHIAAVAQALRTAGHTVLVTREPGGTPLAEQLRELVLHHSMDALTETLLVFAARRDHIQQVIAPALARGVVVLSDRFTDASFAYQGAGRGFDLQMLSDLERTAQMGTGFEPQKLLEPDLTLWFDVPPAVAAQRLAAARQPDRFEGQDEAFFNRVAQGYAARAAAAPQRFVRIDAQQPMAAVTAQALAALAARGWVQAAV